MEIVIHSWGENVNCLREERAHRNLKEGEQVKEEDIQVWADERIAPYKRPRRYLFVDSIPMTFSLKPLRKALREDAVLAVGRDWDTA